jgi:4-hydroxy-tetrahydrodipicolinate reductase
MTASVSLFMHGAAGRMGQRILALALAETAFAVQGGIDRQAGSLRALGLPSDAPVTTALPVLPGAVVIDFSHHTCLPAVAEHCARHGMPLVSGTTGVDPAQLDPALDAAARHIPVVHAHNMSVGVNVLLATAATLARTLGPDYDIEIVEAHHNQKKDAPSGTALAIADSILAATGRTRADLVDGRSGITGARPKGQIGMHALRLGDIVGDHTVYFVGGGERILLGHVAHHRDIFAQGALRAARFVAAAKPGRYTMAQVLGLA